MLDKRKKGRPCKENARTIIFGVRLNEEERDKLIEIMRELDLSPSETFRFALSECYKTVFRY